MTGVVVCFTTTQKLQEAKQLAASMIGEQLAACVQIIPKAISFYEWDGEIQEDEECLLIIKTASDRVGELKDFLENNHSYEVPELIILSADDGLPVYLDWVQDVTQ